MNEATVTEAMRYAAIGWKVVPLYGVNSAGKCSCRRPECAAAGKHPCCGDNWKDFALAQTEEDISNWTDTFKGERNVGLLLGPAGGIIDIECDSPEATAELDRIIGDDRESLVTPTYGSSRGLHRLFRWSSELPDVQKIEISGLEIRIGGGGRSTQSVAPPSRHHTGASYNWLPGLRFDEVEVAPVPAAVMALIETLASKKTLTSPPARVILDKPAVEGGRHNAMLRFACREAMRMPRPSSTEQQDLFLKVAAVNAQFCKPPLPPDEIEVIARSAIEYRLRQAGGTDLAGADEGSTEPELDSQESGLRLTIVQSDPVEYILYCPDWKQWNRTGNVCLSHEELYNGEKIAEVIARQIPQVCLERYPGAFGDLWSGTPASKKGPATEGLLSVLVRDAVKHGRVVAGSPLGHAKRDLLRYLFEVLAAAAPCGSEGTPDADGDPTKMPDGSVWFAWAETAADIVTSRRLPDGSARALRRAVEAVLGGPPVSAQHKYGAVRRLYTKVTREQLDALRRAAFEGVEEGEEIVPAALTPTPQPVAADSPGPLFDDWGSSDSEANDADAPF